MPRQPAPDPRLIRLAEHIGLDPKQTTEIRADRAEGDELVTVTATVVAQIPAAEFSHIWHGDPGDGWVDRHGDVWRMGDDGMMHTRETRPFPRAYVENKWGPLVRQQVLP